MVGHELGNVVGCVVGHELGNVVGCVVGHELGNVVGRGFRNVCAIANAFATKLEHARESRRVTNTAKGP